MVVEILIEGCKSKKLDEEFEVELLESITKIIKEWFYVYNIQVNEISYERDEYYIKIKK